MITEEQREKYRESARRWKRNNSARCREKNRMWARSNPDKKKAYAKKDYSKHSQSYRRRARLYYKEVSAEIAQAKSVPCMDCGQSFHPCVMDFDHVRGEKLFSVAAWNNSSLGGRILERLREEMKKCEVICANCHRLRTFARRKNAKGLQKRFGSDKGKSFSGPTQLCFS
jgi:hypothetical protein